MKLKIISLKFSPWHDHDILHISDEEVKQSDILLFKKDNYVMAIYKDNVYTAVIIIKKRLKEFGLIRLYDKNRDYKLIERDLWSLADKLGCNIYMYRKLQSIEKDLSTI